MIRLKYFIRIIYYMVQTVITVTKYYIIIYALYNSVLFIEAILKHWYL